MTPSYPVRVTVHDVAGEPVAEALVEAIQFSGPPTPPARTDATGAATLDIPEDVEVYNVLALKDGVGFDYFENPSLAHLAAEIHLVLDGAMAVQVRAIDSTGCSAPEASLTPWTVKRTGKRDYVNCSGSQAAAARTDADGIARFGWLPLDLEGVRQFLGCDQAYHCPQAAWIDLAHPGRPLTVRLLRNTLVSGRVLFPDGKAAAGIAVRAEGRGRTHHYCRRQTTSGPNGGYELLLTPDQSYLLAVADDSWAARSLQGVIVRERQPLAGLDLLLLKGTRLRGRVTLGPDPQPAVGQTIALAQHGAVLGELSDPYEEEDLLRWAETDEEGSYQIRLGPGRYRLQGPHPAAPEEITLDGEEEVVRDIHLARAGRGVLGGEVRRSNGDTVGNAAVLGYSIVPGHAWLDTVTDEHGVFSEERWLDRMMVYARDPQGKEVGVVEIGEEDKTVTVVVSSAATARGRVVDGGGPLPKETVFCRMSVGLIDGSAVTFQLETRTDGSGEYSIPGLLAGSSCDVAVLKGHRPATPFHPFIVAEAEMVPLPNLVLQEPVETGQG